MIRMVLLKGNDREKEHHKKFEIIPSSTKAITIPGTTPNNGFVVSGICATASPLSET